MILLMASEKMYFLFLKGLFILLDEVIHCTNVGLDDHELNESLLFLLLW